MPPVIAAALVAAAPALGATAFTIAAGTAAALSVSYASLLVNGALLVAGGARSRRAKRRATAAYEASLSDRKVVLRSADAARPLVYGRARVGGVLAYGVTSGVQSQYLHLVSAMADHELDAIEAVYLGDGPVTPQSITLAQGAVNKIRDSRGVAASVGIAPNVSRPNVLVNAATPNVAPWGTTAVSVTNAGSGWWTVAKTDTSTSASVGQSQAGSRGRSMCRVEIRAGTSTQASIGLFDAATAWGSINSMAGARVISGPGVFTQAQGGLFNVSGLSATIPTVVEVTRFDASSGLFIYPDSHTSTVNGASVQVRAMSLHRGTYGTLPADWTTFNTNQTIAVVGKGSEGNIPYIDVRMCGVAPASGTTQTLTFGTSLANNPVVAAVGQTWTSSFYAKLVGGSKTNLTALGNSIEELTAIGGYLTGSYPSILTPLSSTSPLSAQRYGGTRTLSDATVGRLLVGLFLNATSGAGYDVTVRIGGPQVEQAGAATAFAPTPAYPVVTAPAQGSRWHKFATGGSNASESYTVTGGAITLAVPAESILSISFASTFVDADGQATTQNVLCTFTHTAQSTAVTGITTPAGVVLTGVPVVVTYPFSVSAARVRLKLHHGQAGQVADPDLITESAGVWTAGDVGVGVPYVYARLEFDTDVFASGVPEISAVVRGKRVFDPRTGLTAWSSNPALCAADYLITEVGCAVSEVDWTAVTTAANICDEAVPVAVGTETQVRYSCDGVLSTESDLRENLEAILSSMMGSAVWSGGVWTIRAGAYETPTITLDESDLSDGPIVVQSRLARRDIFNAVRGRIVDPTNGHQLTDFPPYASQTYVAEDGGINDFSQSQNYALGGWSSLNTGSGTAPVITANFAAAPDGTTTATRVQLSIGAGVVDTDRSVVQRLDTPGDNVNRTLSIYLRSNTGANQIVQLRMSGSAGPVTVTPQWQRFTVTGASLSDVATWVGLRGGAGTAATADILMWGWQRVPGASAGPYNATNGVPFYREIVREVDLPMTDDPFRAQRMAKLALLQSRQALVFTATWNLSAYRLTPGDTVFVTLSRYGWSSKVFRIIKRVFSAATGDVKLTMREEASAIYAWNFNEATSPDPAPNTNLPSPWIVAAPTGLAATSGPTTRLTLADGSSRPRVRLSWNLYTDQSVLTGGALLLSWKRAADTVWSEEVRLPGDEVAYFLDGVGPGDAYNVSLRAENGIGARSAYALLSHTVAANAGSNVTRASDGTGVNLLANSQFLKDLQGWAISGLSANLSGGRVNGTALEGSYLVSGGGTGYIYENGSRPGNGVTDGHLGHGADLVPVAPGQRLEGSVLMNTHRCSMNLVVAWYNGAGGYISESTLAVNQTVAPATLVALSAWTRVGGFVVVPAGAVQAMIFGRTLGTSSGADSYLFLTRFFLGRAGAEQTTLSPWADGTLREVNTNAIVANAATETFFAEYAGKNLLASDGAGVFGVNSITVPTYPFAVRVMCTASTSAYLEHHAATGGAQTANLAISQNKTGVVAEYVAMVTAVTASAAGNAGCTAQFDVPANSAPFAVSLQLTRTNFTPPNAAACSFATTRLRVEVIKR
jgi:hypothetical protein